MNAKKIITTILILFVSVSAAYLVISETGKNAQDKTTETVIREIEPAESQGTNMHSEKRGQDEILVYYFHGNMRCPTCLKFEAYAHEALKTAFSKELESGKLRWQLVNIDKPSNEHFIDDYKITTRTLVIVEMSGNKRKGWKKLEKIWDLVKDKAEFIKYIQKETQSYLEKT